MYLYFHIEHIVFLSDNLIEFTEKIVVKYLSSKSENSSLFVHKKSHFFVWKLFPTSDIFAEQHIVDRRRGVCKMNRSKY